MSVSVLAFSSGSAVVACGDVPTGGLSTLCAEGWFRVAALSAVNRPLMMKYGAGGHEWGLYVARDGRAYFVVFDAGGVNVAYSLPGVIGYTRWVHVAGCYDGTACQVLVNGVDVTFASRISGDVVADTGQGVTLGGYIGQASAGFIGRIGWCRVSNACRYPGIPAGPDVPPAVDGQTVAQWNVAEGAGATVDNAEGTAAYDGAITAATWATAVASDKARALPAGVGEFGLIRPGSARG